MAGIFLYAGRPGSGKSTLCLEHVRADILSTGRPALILDPEQVDTWRGVPHARSVEEALEALYGRGISIAFSHENSPEEVEPLLARVRNAGRVSIVVDEARYYSSAWKLSVELTRCARAWRHKDLRMRLNTQRLSDLHQDLVACSEKVYLFRLSSPTDIDRAWRQWGISQATTSSIPRWEYLEHSVGFEDGEETVPGAEISANPIDNAPETP